MLERFIHRVLIRDFRRVYSGTTLENYRANAYIDEWFTEELSEGYSVSFAAE